MGFALWISQVLFKKNLLQSMIGGELQLPDAVWSRLNLLWVSFFALMGVINLYVAYNFSTSTWATFKVFGVYSLMIVFTIGQVIYLSRYMKDDADSTKAAAEEKA
jgi:intracellular septation protein